MKIARVFAIFIGALMVLITALFALSLLESWRRFAATRDGLAAMQLTSKAMLAAEKASAERGPSNGVMGDDDPPDPKNREKLAGARKTTDAVLADLLETLRRVPNDAAALESVRSSMALLSNARLNVDKVTANPRSARTSDAVQSAVRDMFSVIPPLFSAVSDLSRQSGNIYPQFAEALAGAQSAAELREYAGRIGSVLTPALATGNALSLNDVAELNVLRGRVEQLRQLVARPGRMANADPRITNAMDEMNQRYFSAGLALVAEVELASREKRPYPLNTAQFANRYVPEMSAILKVRDTLLSVATDGARDVNADASRSLKVGFGLGGAIMFALTLTLVALRRLVLKPLSYATDALIKIASGNTDFLVRFSYYARKDEVGQLLRAVETVRLQSVETRQLAIEKQRVAAELGRWHDIVREIGNAPDSTFFIMDPHTRRPTFIAKSVVQLTGWTAEEALSQPDLNFLPAEVGWRAKDLMDEATEEGLNSAPPFISIEVQLKHKDGSLIPFKLFGTMLYDQSKKVSFIGVLSKIRT